MNNTRFIPAPVPPNEKAGVAGKQAKSRMYCDYSRPATQEKFGRRPPAGMMNHIELPYSKDGNNAFEGVVPMGPIPANARKVRPVDGKVGQAGYTPKHYSDQGIASVENVEVGRFRNYLGAGKVLYHD
eukprot:CAMPEP_0196571966 /NCGR_PEP_ID=MMETSP1081-20130531/2097_1 /TAXON_ID=36882 /ORGANISM="Pyramimonas amylifera, Strain CCMP720" /LENGTH=127 /DNA_ID=CAMNT_0041889115 /DNA_START=152 /DNA_END=535 /DNA_ORIENTATION=+